MPQLVFLFYVGDTKIAGNLMMMMMMMMMMMIIIIIIIIAESEFPPHNTLFPDALLPSEH